MLGDREGLPGHHAGGVPNHAGRHQSQAGNVVRHSLSRALRRGPLVGCRAFHVIDDVHVHRPLPRFQPEAELILQRDRYGGR